MAPHGSSLLLAGLVACGLLSHVLAIDCTKDSDCVETLFVKNECNADGNCECKEGSMVPDEWGCKEEITLQTSTPVVRNVHNGVYDVYSGEVEQGSGSMLLTMRCFLGWYEPTVSTSYEWLEKNSDGEYEAINDEDKSTYEKSVTITSPDTHSFKCRIRENGDVSLESADPYTIDVIATGDITDFQPEISQTLIQTESGAWAMEFRCLKRIYNEDYSWEGYPSDTVALIVYEGDEQQKTCAADGEQGKAASANFNVIKVTDVNIVQEPMKQIKGQKMLLKCLITATDAEGWDGKLTFSWTRNGKLILGQNDYVLQIQALENDHKGIYQCQVHNSGAVNFARASMPHHVDLENSPFKPCTSLNYIHECRDPSKYNGQCINNRCECKYEKLSTGCKSGASVLIASTLSVLLSWSVHSLM